MSTTVRHPWWCDRRHCVASEYGYHWSRPAVLEPDPRTNLDVTVQLGQGAPIPDWPDSGVPLVELTMRRPAFGRAAPEEYTVILPSVRAVALGRMLLGAGRTAARD
jgi:hypothetical protein